MTDNPTRRAAIVLVVEDEPLQRLMLVDTLEDAGFEILEAVNADAAVAILERRTDIRLVVTDIEMPGEMNGIKLAAAVRDRWPPIEIVVVSAGPAPKREDLPVRAEFLAKPIQMDRLIDKLKRMAA